MILDQPPANELFNQMAEAINQAIRNVKVDTIGFAKLYPDHNWFADSRKEIRTPIGLMGAKDKLEFWFGENEDGNIVSNGLLAGKPGAGKSFTLHAIILSLAMQYSPDELELYLLDFKQGVEFQIYVDAEKGENRDFSTELDETRALPHAKVISIESDREFGLSVLEYVNQQIEERSKLFKSAGNLEKIYEYRNATDKKLPRILVLIDEFQYMFQESDAIAQRLNVVMENIVRQGRAFGIHLLIASQSPNVSNMNRKIYDFLDLRMALQMPQNTAGYVLDESNTDAIDLLDRPGKMIYNF
ncbi:FtsK/SpoIIIE domain-containing protein [Geminocystis sp. CENA526]|uniref:FtsK/SpoIIIE domain-containing protein n=1 Tax=Geminocystis sp. CENA526 TaxID=1355871 RepID=UPI003D6E3858